MAETCGQVLLGSGLTILSHPLMYIKVLVQVGHEPLPPTLGRNLFGRQVYQLPGLFAYGKINKRSINSNFHVCTSYCFLRSEMSCVFLMNTPIFLLSFQTTKEMIARSCATIVTHPFHVITLRCMVQFIGREAKYSGVFDSIVTIYREEGILGFFAGLIPRLLGDILSLWICNMLAHFINTYAIDDSTSHTGEIKNCSQAVTGFFASMLTYPFVLVSNLMAVNNCGLAGGLPPYAAIYPNWLHCWSHLSREGNMSRGNSLFFRKLPAGKMYAVEQKRFF
uniref:Mitochondrial carrier homolog 2 n=1 Tax=Cyprinus carpio carpio TaxID=630221 RepID=A0A9J8AKZ3_CYPCA